MGWGSRDGVSETLNHPSISPTVRSRTYLRLTPPWLDELAPNAILIPSVLTRFFRGRDSIIKVVQNVGGVYEAHSMVFHATFADKELIEYKAQAFGGMAVHGIVILSRNKAGDIFNVRVPHGHLKAVNKLSAALKEHLLSELDAEYFLP